MYKYNTIMVNSDVYDIQYIYTGWWFKKNILKNDGLRQWGWDDIPFMKWKIKFMFETTNQL